ncbi:hypothetical protein L6452_13592 [Arctium lappa]|uniref:Uncharacterized protein n=1 Tax=Arctium lappa TaxID=4217 RepID=A0ACB9CIK2_ARCLA|nr:hypothetical protein L6452_13592 [Arctium lappa]
MGRKALLEGRSFIPAASMGRMGNGEGFASMGRSFVVAPATTALVVVLAGEWDDDGELSSPNHLARGAVVFVGILMLRSSLW